MVAPLNSCGIPRAASKGLTTISCCPDEFVHNQRGPTLGQVQQDDCGALLVARGGWPSRERSRNAGTAYTRITTTSRPSSTLDISSVKTIVSTTCVMGSA
jgi:hypothetical protein